MNLFNFLDAITIEKKKLDFSSSEIKSAYNPFMMNRYLSSVFVYILDVLPVNIFDKIPKECHFKYFFNCMPRKKIFFPYIKRKNMDDEKKELLYKYFKCGVNDLNEMLKFLSEEQVKSICNKYEFGKAR